MIDLSHDMFDKNNIKKDFYAFEPVVSLNSAGIAKTKSNFNTNGTTPTIFKNKKADLSFTPGELPKPRSVGNLPKEIEDLEEEIINDETGNRESSENYQELKAKKKSI